MAILEVANGIRRCKLDEEDTSIMIILGLGKDIAVQNQVSIDS